MEAFASSAEHIFFTVAQIGITLLEFCGVLVLVIASAKALIGYFQKDVCVRLNLAQGIALALEFKLGGEVLRTTVVRDWSELGILGAIILLRGALTLLIHWEIRNEEIKEVPASPK
jgi:uncharacterized membrane protein